MTFLILFALAVFASASFGLGLLIKNAFGEFLIALGAALGFCLAVSLFVIKL